MKNVYSIPTYATQPNQGEVVNLPKQVNGKTVIAAHRISGQPEYHYDDYEGVNYADYPVDEIKGASYGGFERLPDGGCAHCYGNGCDECNYTGGC